MTKVIALYHEGNINASAMGYGNQYYYVSQHFTPIHKSQFHGGSRTKVSYLWAPWTFVQNAMAVAV